jgi:hypothetical protein
MTIEFIYFTLVLCEATIKYWLVDVDVNMVKYDICILSLGYCITLMKVMHV